MSKLLLMGDLHLRMSNPRARVGNFFEDQSGKLNWILTQAQSHGVVGILQPGDFFHRPEQPNFLKQYYLQMLRDFGVSIFAVFGQHDTKYHSLTSAKRTALQVFASAGLIQILGGSPLSPTEWLYSMSKDEPVIFLYGASWEEDTPKIEDPPKGHRGKSQIHILVTHRRLLGGKVLWSGQKEWESAERLLKRTKFDLIVSGDNHQFFHHEIDKRWLVNCGGVMRGTVALESFDHKPTIALFDTVTREVEFIRIPHVPPEVILSRKAIEQAIERDVKMDTFISGLSEEYDVSLELEFRQNLIDYMRENKVEDEVKAIISEVMEG